MLMEKYRTVKAFDEMITKEGGLRPQYETLGNRLEHMGLGELVRRKSKAEKALSSSGITFTLYGEQGSEDRILPFDIIPRIIRADEWAALEAGLVQRTLALNAFLNDVYGKQHIIRDGVISREVIESSPGYLPQCSTFNRRNPNSIVSCLHAARENARSIREKISKDMWESINELYNDVVSVDAARIKAGARSGSNSFYRDIRRSCHAIYGISDGTLNHDESYFFALLGRAIERADKTTRILDLQSYMLTSETQQQFGEGQIVLWLALLRATSAHEMFNQAHARITSENILDFLLLSRTFPRAIIACLLQMEYALRCLAGEQKGFFINAAQKKVQRLLLETRHVDVTSLVGQALNAYLDNLQVRLNEIGTEITNTYFTAA